MTWTSTSIILLFGSAVLVGCDQDVATSSSTERSALPVSSEQSTPSQPDIHGDEVATTPRATDGSEHVASAPPAIETVGVDAVAKDPTAHGGPIAIEGVVGQVVQSRGAFTIIDVAEFKMCGVTTCARYSVPVMVSPEEFEGTLPENKQTVVVIGELEPLEAGYRLLVDEVRRGSTVILRRTAERDRGRLDVSNLLPSTVLSQKEELGLTEDQVASLESAHATLVEEEARLNGNIAHCQAELVELLEADERDEARITHEREEIAEFEERREELRREAVEAVRSALDSAQLSRLAAVSLGGS